MWIYSSNNMYMNIFLIDLFFSLKLVIMPFSQQILDRYLKIFFVDFLSGYFVNFPLSGSKDAAAKEHSAQLENTKIESLPDTKAIKQKESHSKKAIPKEAWSEDKESLQTDIAGNGIIEGGEGGAYIYVSISF